MSKNEYSRDYKKRNPHTYQESFMRRRARKIATEDGTVTAKVYKRLKKMPCVVCGSSEKIEVDHILPLSRGGAHSINNLQPLCRFCNASKGSKTMEEWLGVSA
jgi:5-methylcytosine-specific restriction endonuclease McrA